eukprot:3761193-Pleurochrysis_carterae.AAC.7
MCAAICWRKSARETATSQCVHTMYAIAIKIESPRPACVGLGAQGLRGAIVAVPPTPPSHTLCYATLSRSRTLGADLVERPAPRPQACRSARREYGITGTSIENS